MNTAHSAVAACMIVAFLEAAGGCGRADEPRNREATMRSTYGRIDARPDPRSESDAGSVPEHPREPAPPLRMQVDRIGSGRPLVLIGGGLTGWASWQPHAERLAATRAVARLQLLSVEYGLDDRPLPVGYSIGTERRALAATLDELGWRDPLDLVAWSYGAAVALDFALSHPGRIRRLTLIEPPALWVLPEHGRALPDVQALEALLPPTGGDVGVETLRAFVRTASLVPPGTSPETHPQWGSWMEHRRSLRNGGAVFQHDDDPARLRALRVPVLLVTGDGTSPFLRAVHDTLAATLPDARTLELPGGHAPHLVAMDGFLERLASFQESAGDGPGRKHPDGPRIVTSRDGTPIAFWQGGSGPPLLLVHGATADHTTTWRFVRRDLERRFTVYAMDRRGRGGSGDGPSYDLQREAEDVAAVIDAIGGPVSVLGHSYGALVALEAALLLPGLDRMILYEGVPLNGAELYPPGAVDRLQSLVDDGDADGALRMLFREVVEMPEEELAILRSQSDAWAVRLGNVPTAPRELGTEAGYVFHPDRFRRMTTPTLLLVGGDSPARELANARGVASGLPVGHVSVLPGQQHAAMYVDPGLFVREVSRFLGPNPPSR